MEATGNLDESTASQPDKKLEVRYCLLEETRFPQYVTGQVDSLAEVHFFQLRDRRDRREREK